MTSCCVLFVPLCVVLYSVFMPILDAVVCDGAQYHLMLVGGACKLQLQDVGGACDAELQ